MMGNDAKNFQEQKDISDTTSPIQGKDNTKQSIKILGENQNPKSHYSFKKSAGFLGLVVISVIILSLGVLKIKNTIQAPFRLFQEQKIEESSSPAQEQRINNLLALQNKDTDLDGLSDFDELYIYKTSLYIEDSDSDDYTDKEEVDNGYDPNCPKGQDCYSKIGETEKAQGLAPALGVQNLEPLQLPQGFSSIEELRQALEATGIPSATLKQIGDASLIELYNQTVSETGVNPLTQAKEQNQAQSQELSPELSDYINQLSPDELRQMLIQAGLDEKMLEQIDDETLVEMVAETLGQ